MIEKGQSFLTVTNIVIHFGVFGIKKNQYLPLSA